MTLIQEKNYATCFTLYLKTDLFLIFFCLQTYQVASMKLSFQISKAGVSEDDLINVAKSTTVRLLRKVNGNG